eukprot:80168-Chlamydomonas_euryale.AAC.1
MVPIYGVDAWFALRFQVWSATPRGCGGCGAGEGKGRCTLRACSGKAVPAPRGCMAEVQAGGKQLASRRQARRVRGRRVWAAVV